MAIVYIIDTWNGQAHTARADNPMDSIPENLIVGPTECVWFVPGTIDPND